MIVNRCRAKPRHLMFSSDQAWNKGMALESVLQDSPVRAVLFALGNTKSIR